MLISVICCQKADKTYRTGRNKLKKAKILKFGDLLLRQRAEEVTVFHKTLHDKIDLLKKTLMADEDGAALAASQIGILKRITVIDYMDEYLELINPVIVSKEGSVIAEEGCLSFPGFWAKVKRAQTVTVTYHDRYGKEHTITRSDEMARCIQHEIDHFDGVLYIDHVEEPFIEGDEGQRIALNDIHAIAGISSQEKL